MTELKAGRPSNNKKMLQIEDLQPKTKRVCFDIENHIHKKMKIRAMDEEKGLIDLVTEIIKKEFDK